MTDRQTRQNALPAALAGGKMSTQTRSRVCLVAYGFFVCAHGECFQRRLFVNTITSKRVNIGWWNLAGRCNGQKSRPSLNLGS